MNTKYDGTEPERNGTGKRRRGSDPDRGGGRAGGIVGGASGGVLGICLGLATGPIGWMALGGASSAAPRTPPTIR